MTGCGVVSLSDDFGPRGMVPEFERGPVGREVLRLGPVGGGLVFAEGPVGRGLLEVLLGPVGSFRGEERRRVVSAVRDKDVIQQGERLETTGGSCHARG